MQFEIKLPTCLLPRRTAPFLTFRSRNHAGGANALDLPARVAHGGRMNVAEHLETKPLKLFVAISPEGTQETLCPVAFQFEPQLIARFGTWTVTNEDAGES